MISCDLSLYYTTMPISTCGISYVTPLQGFSVSHRSFAKPHPGPIPTTNCCLLSILCLSGREAREVTGVSSRRRLADFLGKIWKNGSGISLQILQPNTARTGSLHHFAVNKENCNSLLRERMLSSIETLVLLQIQNAQVLTASSNHQQ